MSTESYYPETRNASAQAWRRVSKAIGPGEGKDLAKDIAKIIEVESDGNFGFDMVATIEFALTGFNWEGKKQI